MKSFSAIIRPLAKSAGLLTLVLGMSSMAVAKKPENPGSQGVGNPHNAPEIDPGSMASAMTLLCGGVLILMGRRRK